MKRRVKLKPRSPNRSTWNKLDKLCRTLVVVHRDRNLCQRCGASAERSQMHWAHVQTRGAKSVQWVEWNSLALCAGCHIWFDAHREEGMRWWREKWPERETLRLAWKSQRSRPKLDYELIRQYLEHELDRRRPAL